MPFTLGGGAGCQPHCTAGELVLLLGVIFKNPTKARVVRATLSPSAFLSPLPLFPSLLCGSIHTLEAAGQSGATACCGPSEVSALLLSSLTSPRPRGSSLHYDLRVAGSQHLFSPFLSFDCLSSPGFHNHSLPSPASLTAPGLPSTPLAASCSATWECCVLECSPLSPTSLQNHSFLWPLAAMCA